MTIIESFSICRYGKPWRTSDISSIARRMWNCFQRKQWFENFAGAFAALWWVPAGHIPGVDEAKKRLAYLDALGPTQFAFTFNKTFQPDEEFQGKKSDWLSFKSCPEM